MTSSTSSLCAWNVPSANFKLTHGQPIRLADFTFRKDHYFHHGNYIANNIGPLHVFSVCVGRALREIISYREGKWPYSLGVPDRGCP